MSLYFIRPPKTRLKSLNLLRLGALVGQVLLVATLGDIDLTVVLLTEVFQSLALGFGNQQSGTNSEKHEQSVDLHDVVEPAVRLALGAVVVDQRSNDNLGNNGTNLTRGSRHTVGSRSVTGRENLTGNNEGGGVGSPVGEELGKNVKSKKTVLTNLVVSKTNDAEDSGQGNETTKLNGLAANDIKSGNREPVTGNGTSAGNDNVTDGSVVQVVVDVLLTGVANGLENDGVVKTKPVVGNVKHEPRASSSDKNLSVLPLGEMGPEVGQRGLGDLVLLLLGSGGSSRLTKSLNIISRSVTNAASSELLSIGSTLFDITGDIKSVTGGFRNGKTEVKSADGGDTAETNQNSPHLVNGLDTLTSALRNVLGVDELGLPGNNRNDRDNTSEKLTPALVGKDSCHNGTSPLGSSKLGSDDRGKRVVTTDTDTHNDTPEDEGTNKGNGGGLTNDGLTNGGSNDNHEFNTVNALSADNISNPTKEELANDGTGRSRDLDKGSGRGGNLSGLALLGTPEDIGKHGGSNVNGKDIERVGHETNTSDHDGTDVVPSKGGIVDLLESESSALMGVGDVSEIVDEVVEGSVASSSLDTCRHCWIVIRKDS